MRLVTTTAVPPHLGNLSHRTRATVLLGYEHHKEPEGACATDDTRPTSDPQNNNGPNSLTNARLSTVHALNRMCHTSWLGNGVQSGCPGILDLGPS